MANPESEKQFTALIDIRLFEELDRESTRVLGSRYRKKRLMEQLAKWWIALPDDDKLKLYDSSEISKGKPFGNWLVALIDERIKTIQKETMMPVAGNKTVEQLITESIENIRQYTCYHILTKDMSQKLNSLIKSLGPEYTKRSKTA